MTTNRYTVDTKGVEHTCCNEARVVDTVNGPGWDTVCDCQTEEIAREIADALNAVPRLRALLDAVLGLLEDAGNEEQIAELATAYEMALEAKSIVGDS